ncbi:MAG: phosphate ABC transporter permease subunit PstC [Candidatus Omnitrophica bacterium]|nr:phosphate ABC transporter permease subunit PstC [Candidatus Omnitrophota bacterium]
MYQKRTIKDITAKHIMFTLTLLVSLLVVVIAWGLFTRSRPILSENSLTALLFSVKWHPTQGQFGFAPFILGTIYVTLVAIVLAVPLAIFSAVFLAEYAPKALRNSFKPVLDLLAGISPVIFGAFGVLVIVPLVQKYLLPVVAHLAKFVPFLATNNFTGFGVFSAGIILAMMIFPIMTQVAEEVIHSIPKEVRDSSLALGATHWETIKYVVLKKSRPGIIAAVILGLARAFGETIAVLMVVGNVVQIPKSLFDAAYTLPALIANNYGEMMSIPLYDSALLLAALILLVVTVFFNILAWLILARVEKAYV